MAKPVSNEKRAGIIKHIQAGESRADIAKWLSVCTRTISRVWARYLATGTFEPEPPKSGRKPCVGDETMEKVLSKIKETPDVTLLELIEEFRLPISQAALSRRLIKLGLAYKKRRSTQKGASRKMSLQHGKRGAQARTGWT